MAEIHFAPDGHDANDGSEQEPVATPHEAIDRAEPGDWIYGHDRTFEGVLQRYDLTEHLIINKTGYEAAPFHLVNYRGQNPILDFSSVPYVGTPSQFQQNSLIQMRGVSGLETNWWHLRGLTIQCEDLLRPGVGTPRDTGSGILVSTSHHWFERLTIRWIGRSGITVAGPGLYGFSPGWNFFDRCDFTECYHPSSHGNGSSGINIGWGLLPGNWCQQCRFSRMPNHGFDTWAATEQVLFDHCWSYYNGENLWNDPYFYGGGAPGSGGYEEWYVPRSTGNGCKLDTSHVPPKLRRCLIAFNRFCGIISGVGRLDPYGVPQEGDGWEIEHCTFVNNGDRNINMSALINHRGQNYKARNSISLYVPSRPYIANPEPGAGDVFTGPVLPVPTHDILLATADFSHNSFSHHTLDQSLATAKWSFDSSLTASDLGDLNLTNNGAVTSGAGRFGNAAQFSDGKHLSVSSTPAIESAGGSITVECWVKFDTIPTAGQLAFIAAKGVPFTAANYEWYLYFHGGLGVFVWGVSNGTTAQNVGSYQIKSTPDWTGWQTGEWMKLVGRCDIPNGTLSIELNGSWMDTVAWTGGTYSNASAALRIGGITGHGFLEGLVDEFVFHKGLPWLHNTATADDFESLDPAWLDMPRRPDGSLPVTPFARLKKSSPLRNAGVDIGLPYEGAAPDLGAFQTREDIPRAMALTGGFEEQ